MTSKVGSRWIMERDAGELSSCSYRPYLVSQNVLLDRGLSMQPFDDMQSSELEDFA